MSLFSTFGARPAASPTLPATVQGGGRTLEAQYAPASGKVAARLPTVDPVVLQDAVVSISSEGMTGGAALPRSTSQSAQSFMNAFARRLFGDQAGTASVAYNLKSSLASRVEAAPAARTSAELTGAFDLDQPARFTGIGQISTGDGRSFEFELKVNYEPKAALSEAALRRNARQVIETPDVLVLTGKALPEIQFPGTLDDLYKMLSRELRTEVSSGSGSASIAHSGELTLRLQRLVDRAALIAPRARPDDPGISASERAKAVAHTYATTAAGQDPPPA